MKPLAHTVVIAGILNAVSLFPQRPGVSLALSLIQPGAFTIFAASAAATLHQRKALILVILATIIVLGYPFDLVGFSQLLIPQGIGLVLGNLARNFFRDEQVRKSHDPESADR